MSVFTPERLAQASAVLQAARTRGWMISIAESCTGGLISACLTEIAGSSDVFDRGFVSYSYAAKIDLLDVQEATLATYGAVSEQAAIEMAAGALRNSRAQIAVAVTGIAGPGGATPEKPVGLVYLALATSDGVIVDRNIFSGDRSAVRMATLDRALVLLAQSLAV